MSVLAALILAVGACGAATLLFVPLQRLAEVLSELEIRAGVRDVDITAQDDAGDWIHPAHKELASRIRDLQKQRAAGGAS